MESKVELFKKNKLVVVLLVLLSMSFIKCSNGSYRSAVLPDGQIDGGGSLDQNSAPQVTTLTDIIDSGDHAQSYIAKEMFIKETLNKVIDKGLASLELPVEELPWEKIHQLFTEMGAKPKDAFSIGQRVHVYSDKSVNGLRYLNAGFDVVTNEHGQMAVKEKFLAFEVEKFEGNFETTIGFLEELFLGEDAEPCLDTKQDQVFFKKEGWIIEVFTETKDSIDLNSVYPPRTLDDVGVVKVSISAGGHYHQLENEGSCFSEDNHEHSSDQHE